VGIIFLTGLVFSIELAKQYAIFLVIIYIGSLFIKLGARFIWNISKSIDHRRRFKTCFLYLFLYCLALFLIVITTKAEWLNWGYFLIYFPLDYYYFQFIPWPNQKEKEKTSKQEEWEEGITFAIVMATLIHVFFLQPFTIPTSSMEKSMLVGDFLIVSKMNYGANIPNTPLFLPFMHQKIPGTENTPSYSKIIQLGYNRLPGFQKVKNNDVVVFNFPVDTLRENIPFDKKMNYVKRCIGIAGDSLSIIDKEIYINGIKNIQTDEIKTQFQYIIQPREDVTYKSSTEFAKAMNALETFLIKNDIETYAQYRGLEGPIKPTKKRKEEKKYGLLKNTGVFIVFLTEQEKLGIETYTPFPNSFIFKEYDSNKNLFPKTLKKNWTVDNYGPIYIPQKDDSLMLNKANIHFYKKTIEEYENRIYLEVDTNVINDLKDLIKIDEGKANDDNKKDSVRLFEKYLHTEEYIEGYKKIIKENPNISNDTTHFYVDWKKNTWKVGMNYYWMMGDNRHNSEDSRVWGFVPENHIVGKPVFTWLSLNYNAINKKSFTDKLQVIRLSRSPIIWLLLSIFLIKLIRRFVKKNKK
jgi:signal peptidase I